MQNYDFKTLSSHDFEECVRDLLQGELKVRLESFTTGRDKGIDLRYSPIGSKGKEGAIIVQCKHYAESGYASLYRHLIQTEVPKIRKLMPSRYILATSVSLTPTRKDQIQQAIAPYCLSSADIYGKDDLNNLLGVFSDVEKKNFKLWLSSQTVLSRIIHSKLYNSTQAELERIKRQLKLYVQNDSFFRATEILNELHYCIIAGIPGIGKTTLADILLIDYLRRGYEPFKLTHDVSEAYSVLDQNKKQIFYYDDFLGQTNLDGKLNKNEDGVLLRFIDTARRSKRTKLILTTREYILAQAKATYEKLSSSNFDYKKCVIDLNDYTRHHKAKILYNHVYFSGLKKEYLDGLLANRNYMEIINHPNFNPRIVEGMTTYVESHGITPNEYHKSFVSALANPAVLWKHAFELQLSDAAQHVLMVLSSLPDEVALDDLNKAFRAFYNLRSKEFGFSISPLSFKDALKELEGNFVTLSKYDDVVTAKYHNPSIKDFIQNYIYDDVSLGRDLVLSSVFFDQLMILWGPFSVDSQTREKAAITSVGDGMEDCIRRLLKSDNCRLIESRSVTSNAIIMRKRKDISLLSSRAIYAFDIARRLKLSPLMAYIFEAVSDSAPDDFNASSMSLLIQYLSKHAIDPPSRFLDMAKGKILNSLQELDDFELVQDLATAFPNAYVKGEIASIRSKFEQSCDDFVDYIRSDANSSAELREYATQLRSIAEGFEVDVEEAYTSLTERADELDSAPEDGDPGDYEAWKEEGRASMRDEEQIHSMFDSLR